MHSAGIEPARMKLFIHTAIKGRIQGKGLNFTICPLHLRSITHNQNAHVSTNSTNCAYMGRSGIEPELLAILPLTSVSFTVETHKQSEPVR